MKLGIATPVSLRRMQDLVQDGALLPVGYEFAPSVDWVRHLLQSGHEITLYTTAKDVDGPVTFRGERLTIRIAKLRSWGTGKDLFAAERVQLKQMMSEDDCEIIHAHWTYEFALAALASGKPTLVTIHDLPWNVLRYFHDKFRFARLLMAYSAAWRGRDFTAVSEDAARHFRHFLRPGASIKVIANGLSDEIFELATPPSSGDPKVVRFATVLQGWSARKNGGAALQAFAQVRSSLPDAELTMFGKDYETGGPAFRWAQTRGLLDGVHFVGKLPYRELLVELQCRVDVFVHPSLDEAFSMAVLEAMALRKPIIGGAATPGVPEALDGGNAGILTDMKNSNGLAKEMLNLAQDPALRESLGKKAHDRARNVYRLDAIMQQYETLYREISARASHHANLKSLDGGLESR